ncbi:MAG: hypothetical protein OXC95_08745 [Dehalococcoidia bacterium]|nr:hypothetical protein [Dehalococcoidia bacterium]
MATVYHGTATRFDGYPSEQQDAMYGIRGIYLTEDFPIALNYAVDANTENKRDGAPRIFQAQLDVPPDEIEDLTEVEDDDEFYHRLEKTEKPVLYLPDSHGGTSTDREILYTQAYSRDPYLRWQGVRSLDASDTRLRIPTSAAVRELKKRRGSFMPKKKIDFYTGEPRYLTPDRKLGRQAPMGRRRRF